MPWELEVGLLVQRLNRLPHELGLTERPDSALLLRSLEAVFIFETARHYASGEIYKTGTDAEWALVQELRRELLKKYGLRRRHHHAH
ncbi:MAG TPA: hypothetical protein VGA61_04390 [Anaerolineae bacterium]